MANTIREAMTSNPCSIDATKTVDYAAKMMRDEDVGVSTKVVEVASKEIVTVDPQQDLDEALRLMAKHQVRRLPVVEEDGRLVGVLAQADVAREGDDVRTGEVVEQISE